MFGLFKRDREISGEAHEAPTRIVEERIPLVAETLDVDVRQVEGDTVRVDIRTETETRSVNAELLRDAVDVRRVPADRAVDVLPVTRTEGDTTIVPVVRERLVLKKELVLVEEIHITHRRERTPVTRDVELRRQVPDVTRTPARLDAAE